MISLGVHESITRFKVLMHISYDEIMYSKKYLKLIYNTWQATHVGLR